MNYYFKLQYHRSLRYVQSSGIHPLFAGILALPLFIGLSKFIFLKSDMAHLIYVLLAFLTISSLSAKDKNNHLQTIFSKKIVFIIRFIENTLVALPFALYLIYERRFWFALVLMGMSWVSLLFDSLPSFNKTIPTPFKRIPFECIVGFRNSYLLILFIPFLLFKSIQIDNPNLGLFALVALFILCISFYGTVEKVFFVWIFSFDPKQFLLQKLKAGLIGISTLTFPIFISLLIFFPNYVYALLAILFFGYLFFVTFLFAKYASFPNPLNIPSALLLALGFSFPPSLFVLVFVFYKQATIQLKNFLE